MIYSHLWLKEYVPGLPSPQELMEKLTRHSVEVEGVVDAAALLSGIVVGHIVSVAQHPNADRLQICMVDDGTETLPVVCGGSNLSEGMRVAFARVGAQVRWHGEGELITLEPATIRGEESRGMICASDEIGLDAQFPKSSEKEILDLSEVLHDVAPGTPLAAALQLEGAVIDIDNKSMTHRSDLFSHTGMAREIAAVFDLSYTQPDLPALPQNAEPLHVTITEPALCSRYMAAEFTIQMTKTPDVITHRLQECGIKSINPIVDITNYVMLEWGQPLHAFDADTLVGDIVVRPAQLGETITTLDKIEKKLDDSILVIADSEKPIAVAGVIGGLDTGVTEKTTRIILEAANFDSLTVRRAAQKIQSRTDSALRFEKGIPPQRAEQGFLRAMELLKQYADAKLIRCVDEYPKKVKKPESIEVDTVLIKRLAGIEFDATEVQQLLERIECDVDSAYEGESITYHVTPPWFRTDLHIPEDIIEEIVRLRGTDTIPEQKLHGQLEVPRMEPELALKQKIRSILQSVGAMEVYNYSFYGADLIKQCQLNEEEHLEIENPLSADQQYLRTTVLPRLLENVALNQHHRDSFTLFEVGHIYFADREEQQLGIIVYGENALRKVRGMTEYMFQQLGLNEHIHIVATVDTVDQHIFDAYDISSEVGYALVSINALLSLDQEAQQIKEISQYPAITLDWSIIVDQDRAWGDIEDVIRKEAGPLLQSVQVFDMYTGDRIPQGKKSIAFTVVLQSHTETLQMKKIEVWRDQLMQKLHTQFGVELRDR